MSLRILWVGDPPLVYTGYGGQAALFIPRLRAAGHDVALLAVGGSAGATYVTPDGLKVYPTVLDPRGNDVVAAHARDHRADVVFTLGDPHVFDPAVYRELPWLAWAPLDFETPTKATKRSLEAARWIWAPSSHAEAAYKKFHSRVTLVPHGVHSSTFVSTAKKDDGRFIVIAIAANKGTPSRKGFFELFSAFRCFAANRSPSPILYLHTDPAGIAGEDLMEMMEIADLDLTLVTFPDRYRYLCGGYTASNLASMYATADVYLSTSHGEGFHLPAVEAQMAGLPVIAADHTANADTCCSGKLVRSIPYVPFDGATTWRRPIVQDITEALIEINNVLSIIRSKEHRNRIRDQVMHFDIDRVLKDKFLPALTEVERQVRN